MAEANRDMAAESPNSLQKFDNQIGDSQKSTPPNSYYSGLLNNSVPKLSLGLSLSGYCNETHQQVLPLIRSSSANRPLTLNENGRNFVSLARSSSFPSEREAKDSQLMKRSVGDVGRSPPQVVASLPSWAAVSASKNSAFCRAMGKIKSAITASSSAAMQGPCKSTGGSAPTSNAMPSGRSIKPQGPVIGCRVTKHGIFDIPADFDVMRPTKRTKVSDDNIIYGVTGMELLMQMMPSVSTTAKGPDGKKIEGFLCSYLKGAVLIVCVCHGEFLTPAEFVKHAGWDDVANPMKHINVLPLSV